MTRYKNHTGIITSVSLVYIKNMLETLPIAQTKSMDVVAFEMHDTPEVIHRKPVYFCTWDGRHMGETAVRALVTKTKYPKIQYLPMTLDRNIK